MFQSQGFPALLLTLRQNEKLNKVKFIRVYGFYSFSWHPYCAVGSRWVSVDPWWTQGNSLTPNSCPINKTRLQGGEQGQNFPGKDSCQLKLQSTYARKQLRLSYQVFPSSSEEAELCLFKIIFCFVGFLAYKGSSFSVNSRSPYFSLFYHCFLLTYNSLHLSLHLSY